MERYLSDMKPLAACHWCLGTSGTRFPHRQLTGAARIEALAAEHADPAMYLEFSSAGDGAAGPDK
jgi:hypothetical protein